MTRKNRTRKMPVYNIITRRCKVLCTLYSNPSFFPLDVGKRNNCTNCNNKNYIYFPIVNGSYHLYVGILWMFLVLSCGTFFSTSRLLNGHTMSLDLSWIRCLFYFVILLVFIVTTILRFLAFTKPKRTIQDSYQLMLNRIIKRFVV